MTEIQEDRENERKEKKEEGQKDKNTNKKDSEGFQTNSNEPK